MKLAVLLVMGCLLLGIIHAEEANLLTERVSLRADFIKHRDDEFIGQGDVDNRWEIFDPVVKVKPPVNLGHCPGNELILIIYGESILNKKTTRHKGGHGLFGGLFAGKRG